MKHLNFLSKSSSRSCGHSSVTLASTVGSPSAHRRVTMLRLLSVLVLILTIGVGNVWGEEEVYKETIFNSTNNSAQKNQYGDDWYNTTNGFRVDIENASNNNNAWEYIKIGNKNNAYTGIITTNSAIDDKITKVSINIGGIQSSYVTSITLYTSPNNSTWTSRGTFTKSTGWQNVSISAGNQAANLYYKIEVVTSNSSQGNNGRLQINGIKYYHEKASGFSITYHCNGATSNCPSDATGQTKLPATLPTPVRTGCTFAGWYTNEGLTTAASAGATLSANADLYAKWTCNVTLNRNGVADNSHTNVAIGTTLASLQGEGAQGGCSAWTFVGWSKTQRAAQDNSDAMTLVTTVDGPGPYYAVYSHTETGGESTASSDNLSSTSTSAQTVETGKSITYTCSSSNTYSNPARIYKNQTFTIAGGTITSISLTGVEDYAISNMTVNTGTLSTSGNDGTWEGSATSVVFTAATAQTRISAISVTYTGGSTTYYSTTATCCDPLGQINGSFF